LKLFDQAIEKISLCYVFPPFWFQRGAPLSKKPSEASNGESGETVLSKTLHALKDLSSTLLISG